ncbi:hypothetical protein B0H65DRAFT_541333 [Neurospora tetraspora]|uniref:Uncharacterized protein n=1 Tax=Neurospora tetraspora TaxID=94610 RepID=A0AAE0JBM5_9PEZI|nr:hypothetical protein B0H65DRAFT_541333 [Neurospora tetraspora]
MYLRAKRWDGDLASKLGSHFVATFFLSKQAVPCTRIFCPNPKFCTLQAKFPKDLSSRDFQQQGVIIGDVHSNLLKNFSRPIVSFRRYLGLLNLAARKAKSVGVSAVGNRLLFEWSSKFGFTMFSSFLFFLTSSNTLICAQLMLVVFVGKKLLVDNEGGTLSNLSR